ncbi:transketolase family protein [Klebsiella pneumoniae]|uniref:transketolase family protein n=9 Tax=Klebsiella pneumoniae TaxID=573 RepID=UPI001F354A88|nr:transketolase C-terminal domain-containing protein [Klebsiella pneumoniae]
MSNAEHLANVMVEAFIAAVERGAEQSMVGTAAGLALGGKVAVTCNAAPFLISRANEQIKVDVCYNNTNVKLFGLNAGASYGPLASTHHAIDDLAVMRGFGNIQIFAPSSPRECRQIIDYAIGYQGPVYIRLDGKALPELHDESYRFVPGAIVTLREGDDIALVATGSTVHEIVDAAQMLADAGIQAKVVSVPSLRPCDTAALLAALKCKEAVITVEHNVNGREGDDIALVATGSTVHEIVDAAQMLADAGIQAKVVSVPSLRPCDTAALLAALKPCKAVITVEEHNVNGGVGSLVAEVLAEAGVGIPLKRLGIPDGEYAAAADRGWLRKHHGFDAASVAELAQKMR